MKHATFWRHLCPFLSLLYHFRRCSILLLKLAWGKRANSPSTWRWFSLAQKSAMGANPEKKRKQSQFKIPKGYQNQIQPSDQPLLKVRASVPTPPCSYRPSQAPPAPSNPARNMPVCSIEPTSHHSASRLSHELGILRMHAIGCVDLLEVGSPCESLSHLAPTSAMTKLYLQPSFPPSSKKEEKRKRILSRCLKLHSRLVDVLCFHKL